LRVQDSGIFVKLGGKLMTPISYLLRFIEEDAPFGDATSEAVIPREPGLWP